MTVLGEHRFRAMGTDVHVVVPAGHEALLAGAEARVRWYERRWSRFVPGSELCRLNVSAGRPVVLPADTFALVALAVAHWRDTGGRFDPTVLDALEAAGYDRSFESIERPVARPGAAAPGAGGVVLDRRVGAVTLPVGVRLDLGGLAKGHAADLVAAWLLDAGATGALVSIGGDLRCLGEPPAGAWSVELDDPRTGGASAVVHLHEGGVATSSSVRRRWTTSDGQTAHHLIDPATGRPAATDVLSASVLAATAAEAEVLAKVAVLAGSHEAPRLVRAAGATGVLVTTSGAVRLGGLDAFLGRPATTRAVRLRRHRRLAGAPR